MSCGPYNKAKKIIYNVFNADILAGGLPGNGTVLMVFNANFTISSEQGQGETSESQESPN